MSGSQPTDAHAAAHTTSSIRRCGAFGAGTALDTTAGAASDFLTEPPCHAHCKEKALLRDAELLQDRPDRVGRGLRASSCRVQAIRLDELVIATLEDRPEIEEVAR